MTIARSRRRTPRRRSRHGTAAGVGGGSVRMGVAPIISEDLRAGTHVGGHVEQPGRAEPVVGIHVLLVAQRGDTGIGRDGMTGRQEAHRGVAPESELAVSGGDGDVGGAGVYVEQLPGHRVRRQPPVRRRAEPRIPSRCLSRWAGPRDPQERRSASLCG